MAADNQVVLEGIARFEALQRAVQLLVADAEGNLAKLGRNHPLVLDTAAASVQVDRVLAALRRTRDEAGAPRVLRIRTEDAEARVAALASQIKAASTAVTDFGPPDPFGKFRASLNTAGAAVGDFVTRTTTGSATFGRGFEAAATKSKLALEGLQREIRDTAAAGSPIPPAVVAQVDRLETEYRQATTAAHQFRVAQAGVREGIRSTTPPINDLTASVNRAATAVKAFVVARAIQELGQLGGASFTASEKLKAIHRQFETIFEDRADEEFAFVRAETERLGLELATTADNYIKLANAAENSELKGQGVRRLFTQLSEGAIVSRLSTNDFGLVLRAFSQILGGSTFRMEELTTQLRDSLPQSYGIALEAVRRLSIGQDDFRDAVKGGLLGSAEFAREFGKVWQEQIGKEVPAATQSATAEIGRLNTASFESEAALGDKLSPALSDLAKDFRQLLVDGRGTIEVIGTIGGAFVKLAQIGLATGDVTRNALKGIALAVQGLAVQLVPGGATFADFFETAQERLAAAREGVDRLADIISGRGRPALDGLAAGAATAGDAVDDAGQSFNFAQRQVRAALAEIDKMAKALPATGEIQEAVANKIVKAIDKQLVAIRSLPVAEQVAFAERATALETLRGRLEEFTTKYQKEQEKQAKAAEALAKREADSLKSRSEGFEQFIERVRQLGREAIAEATGEKAGEDIQKRLDEARAELAGLESKPLQSGEDVARIDELRESIRGLDRDLKRAGQTGAESGALANAGAEQVAFTAGEATKAFKAGILEAVAGSKEFLNLFARLGPEGKDQLEALTRGILATAEAGQLSEQAIEGFAKAVSVLAEESGTVVGGFVERIKALGGSAAGALDPVGTAFGALKQQADELAPSLLAVEDAEAKLEERAAGLAGNLQAAAEKATEFVAFSPSVVEGIADQGEGFLRASDAASKLELAQGGLVSSFENVIDTTNRTSDGVLVAGDRIVRFGEQATEAGGTLTRAGGEIIKLKGAGEEAAEGLGKGAEGATKLADGTEQAAAATDRLGPVASHAKDEVTNLGEAARVAGTAATEGAKGVDDLGVAATAAVSPMGALAEQVKKVTGVDLPKFFGDTAEKVGAAAESATDLAEGVGKVGTAATENEGELESLRDRGAEIADKWGAADAAVAGFNERAGIAIGLCKELTTCLAGLAAS